MYTHIHTYLYIYIFLQYLFIHSFIYLYKAVDLDNKGAEKPLSMDANESFFDPVDVNS